MNVAQYLSIVVQVFTLSLHCFVGSLPEQVTSNQIAAGKTFSTILAVFGILGLIFLTTFLMCCDFYEDRYSSLCAQTAPM